MANLEIQDTTQASRDVSAPSVSRTAGQTMIVFAGNGISTALGFLSSICIMRALGPDGFGVVVVAITVLTVFWQLTGRGIDQALVRCVALLGREDPAKTRAVYQTVHQIKLVLGGLLLLVGLAISIPLTRFFLGPEAFPGPICIAVIAALAASIWSYTGACLQASNEFGKYTIILVINAAIRFAFVGTLFVLGRMTPSLAMLAMGFGYLLAAVIGYALSPTAARGVRGQAELRPMVYAYSRWLVISSVIHLLYTRLDQLMLSRMVGMEQTGVYGAAASFIQMVDLLTASLVTVLLPSACKHDCNSPLRRQAWASVRTSAVLAALMLPGFFLADPIIGKVLGSAFQPSILFFKVIFIGALFNIITHPLQVIMHAKGKTHMLTVLDIALLVACGVCNYVAIDSYGALGAAVVALLLRVTGGLFIIVLVLRELKDEKQTAETVLSG